MNTTKTHDGVSVLDEITIDGKHFYLVDPGVARYMGGVLVRYYVCPKSQFKRDINNLVDVVNQEAEDEVRNSESS